MSRVLLVDDDRDGLQIRRLICERACHTVFAEGSSEGARRAFVQNSPEIVVLDLRLPRAEVGLALIREFRAQAPQVRIIVVPGWMGDLHERPEAEMVDAVLEKPFRPEALVRALTQAVDGPNQGE